jgi:WD40 repeat protein
MLSNSETLAAATTEGVELYTLNGTVSSNRSKILDGANLQISPEDEILKIASMQSPISYENLLVAAKQETGLMLFDLRSQRHSLSQKGIFSGYGGAISSMSIGKDAYTITIGTLGGYVATYDIRYGVTSALYMHHLNWPVLALQTFRKNALNSISQ